MASRDFLGSTATGGLTAAATAAHLRDHGTGPWGEPGRPGGDNRVVPPPARAGADGTGWSVCMHVGPFAVTTASMIAELPHGIAEGAPLRVFVAPGSPCAALYVPAFPRSAAGPPPYVPTELSGEDLWRAADAVRARIERDPGVLPEVRAVLQPVEDELWAESDDVFEHPGRWAAAGTSWGPRALAALRDCTG
jgi:hypothetical protein